MTTFAFSIQNRVGGRVELCIGKFVRQRKQLGKINSFMVKASHLSRKDASKSTRRKIFFLSSFSPNFSALEIGGCCSKTSERRGRNFADCIFAIPLQEKDSFKEMFLAKEAKVAFPPMPHWLQQQT